MKNYNEIDINNMSEQARYELLLEIIPKLKRYVHSSGSEGTAYSIGENLVVKEYDKVTNRVLLDTIFESYCEESRAFAEKGYVVPQIYSWTKIPAKKTLLIPSEDRYFVLEEKIPGRELFIGKLDDLYYLFKNEYSLSKFDKIIKNPKSNVKNFKEIARAYINDFININSFIEAMPEGELENFILSIYNMFKEATYSVPDINRRNVFLSGNSLKIIDNYMTIKNRHAFYKNIQPDEFLATMLVVLFKSNSSVKTVVDFEYVANSNDALMFEKMIEENKIICAAALEKLLKVMKKCINGREIKNDKILLSSYKRLAKILDEEKSRRLIKCINKNYLGM